jgi:menaquinone-dependent protoporphyrinogen oxidase
VRRNTDVLATKPVWFFSSGPIGESATGMHDVPPVGQVRKLMERVGARGHTTFGGRLSPDAQGFPARAMAEKMAGDWRDEETVKLWVKDLTTELG